MGTQRKITVLVQSDLLVRAQKAAHAGISETIRKGLELLAASDVYDGLLKMRGKVKFSINLNELRRDRAEPQLFRRSTKKMRSPRGLHR
jgi:hypothetical protein